MTWRPLAYIPCEHYYSQNQYNGLASSISAQQPGAMDAVYLHLGGKGKYVNLRIPLAFIIGDNHGGDSIAGRSAFYGRSSCHISRTCDTHLHIEEIKTMVIAQDWEGIHNLHQCPCCNPFFDVCHFGYPGRIFTSACPPTEALHTLKNGVFPQSLRNDLGGRLKPKQVILLNSAVQSWTKLP
jgi:hypothetical protein